MPFKRAKFLSSISRTRQGSKSPAKTHRQCPKTGRSPWCNRKYRWLMWVFPIAGLLSLIWFLIRVIPKPSRATYPCQRMTAPIAGGFVVWITGLIGSTLAYRKARRVLRQSRYVLAGIFVVVSVMAVWLSLSLTGQNPAAAAFTPTDPPNSPMGVAKGIHPGRVVWVHDPAAANWDGSTGNWWDEDNTNQDVVDYMVSKSIQTMTGQSSDPNAWDALFRHFNQTKGFGDISYQQGEKITIKINMNQDSGSTWGASQGMPSPQMIHSLLEQLINVVGVPGSAITVYDASRYIGNPIYNKVRSNSDPNFQDIKFVVSSTRNGRFAAARDTGNPLHTRAGTANLPRCVTGAKYLINMALLRPHTLYGVTLCAKNHFGSTYFSGDGWTPSPLHNHGGRSKPMDTYNCLVNLNGHKHLSGKTLLYTIDGLYPAVHQSGNVIKWESFGDDWFSGILVSQDPVAIDSVGLDFLRYEDGINTAINDVTGYPDNYLHEMALADNPPSGTFYDPENDGTRLASLGVHEHWNNPVEKKYSRNLGIGDGIELVVASFATEDGPIENETNGKRYDYIRHAVSEAEPGDKIAAGPGIYHENIDFQGKNLTFSSTNPDDPAVVATTIISGENQAVTFSSAENASCILSGFTITDANTGIYCSEASPTIANCIITDNKDAGIELRNGSDPTITNCEIAFNAGAGLEMWMKRSGRFTIYNHPTITNSIIASNYQHGISGGMPTIANCTIVANSQRGISSIQPTVTNSIIYYNSFDSDIVQIESNSATVTYSDVQGGWPGEGNIDIDPYFVDPNSGDYHLKSQAGHWDPNSQTWVQDDVTSPCIDAGNPMSPIGLEPFPNGGFINMGGYGGTPEASKSYFNEPVCETIMAGDINGDCKVNFADFAIIALHWLEENLEWHQPYKSRLEMLPE